MSFPLASGLVIYDICGVEWDKLLGRLRVVTMWLISTVWTPVDDSTTQTKGCHLLWRRAFQLFLIHCVLDLKGSRIGYILVKCSFYNFLKLWSWSIGELTYLLIAARDRTLGIHYVLCTTFAVFRVSWVGSVIQVSHVINAML